ncbi:hypothetical protein BDN72DRAFT_860084 [Pluteus cervinus]|uniref:Uncharacterized protein n=1 Tax=Pluteus cervinus TaxID=181527 RepID=A0ACD3AL52_9AGAR|nr:hypothetical protein BDN72DRAFT_860084 [Pluteus cervinus]
MTKGQRRRVWIPTRRHAQLVGDSMCEAGEDRLTADLEGRTKTKTKKKKKKRTNGDNVSGHPSQEILKTPKDKGTATRDGTLTKGESGKEEECGVSAERIVRFAAVRNFGPSGIQGGKGVSGVDEAPTGSRLIVDGGTSRDERVQFTSLALPPLPPASTDASPSPPLPPSESNHDVDKIHCFRTLMRPGSAFANLMLATDHGIGCFFPPFNSDSDVVIAHSYVVCPIFNNDLRCSLPSYVVTLQLSAQPNPIALAKR